jgi:adenylate cyclase
MNQTMKRLRERWLKENQPEINVRMGLNTGIMLVGNMGSAQRMNYTMMGDAVNLASRLEGANKVYKSDMMISQNTFQLVQDHVDARELDTIRVVGKTEPVTVYQLLDFKDRTVGAMADLIDVYTLGLNHYKQRDYAAALERFNQALAIQHDGPTETYIARCQDFISNPPAEDWDGIYSLVDKG